MWYNNSYCKYFNDKSIFPWKLDCEGQKPIAVIMIGLPGSGKNTWIEKYSSLAPDAVHLSRDDIRIELGYCKPGEKYLGTKEEEDIVTEVYDKKLNAAIKEKRNVILNNVHLKKKYREISVNLLRKVGYHIEFVYVEAPTLEDNYPTTNLEAIACGTPVICFNTGGCSEQINSNVGKIINKNSLDELLYEINNFLIIQRSKTNG